MRTIAILPVKRFDNAKQRLSGDIGAPLRASLAEAMAEDVLEALASSECVDEILVVTAGARPRSLADRHRARVLHDTQTGHNEAAAAGVRRAVELGAARVLLVPGDCPALDPAELHVLLDRPVPSPSVLIVPDRHGTGTNALVLTPPDAMTPSFGPDSCERHRATARACGLHHEVVEVPSLALDVDTAQDLAVLAESAGRARRTLALLSPC